MAAGTNNALGLAFAMVVAASMPAFAEGPAIAVGDDHACAVTLDGRVKCWGRNDAGQLGDNTGIGRSTPVEVVGLPGGVIAIATGASHTCAVTVGGGAKCWGANNSGQLGDGTNAHRFAPVDVTGLASGVVAVAAGDAHTCALMATGALKCWGANSSGQLGNGTQGEAHAPVSVTGLSGVQAVAASGNNTCGVLGDGGVACWGYAGLQQVNCRSTGLFCVPGFLGGTSCSEMIRCDFAPRNQLLPTRLAGGEPGMRAIVVSQMTFGPRVCGVTREAQLACWDIAQGSQVSTPFPQAVIAVALGNDFTCTVDSAGGVHCSGWNMFGQLGDGSNAYRGLPVSVAALPDDIVGISASAFSACAMAANGAAYCWGSNTCGQLGDGTYVTRRTPVSVVGLDAASLPGGVTGLWWNPSESGWGLNISHQGEVVFATLFTYDARGQPAWLVMSRGERRPGASAFTGDLYRVAGSPFGASPLAPLAPQDVNRVGTMSIDFDTANSASLVYSIDGVGVAKSIRKQVFGSRPAYCVGRSGSRKGVANYQDLWWNPAEPGWGLGIAHQDDTLFASLYAHGDDRRDVWLVMTGGMRQADGTYSGVLYQTTGPPFNAVPFAPITADNLRMVGTMRLGFADGETGTLTYSVNGIGVTKPIARQVFASPAPACN